MSDDGLTLDEFGHLLPPGAEVSVPAPGSLAWFEAEAAALQRQLAQLTADGNATKGALQFCLRAIQALKAHP